MTHDSSGDAARSVNPSPWSRDLGHDQAHRRDHPVAVLAIGGQRPVDATGRLLHAGDAAAQVALTLDNVSAVLEAAGFGPGDVVHLRIHATSRAALLDAQYVVREHLAEHRLGTPVTTIQVGGLALVGMEVEIDGLAVRTQPPPGGTTP